MTAIIHYLSLLISRCITFSHLELLSWTVRPLFDPFPLSAESDSPADSKVNVVLTCESSIDT